MFKMGQTVKRNDSGIQVKIVDVIPNGLQLFYRVEYEDGRRIVMPEKVLRPVFSEKVER